MNVLTAAEMAEVDAASLEAGISLTSLIERAGTAVAQFCLRRFPTKGLIVIACGKGSNGCDGLIAARVLAARGCRVRAVLLGLSEQMQGEAAKAMCHWRDGGHGEFVEVGSAEELRDALAGAALIVDAAVGTGFKPPLRGLPADLRTLLMNVRVPIVAVDLPSGWDADSVEMDAPDACRADAVVTFAAPKLAHVFGHLTTDKTFGPVVVADIGAPVDDVRSETGLTWTGAAKAMTEVPRGINGNKGKFGHVLVASGSAGKAGAPSMAALAAMRAGAGLVTAAVPSSILQTVALIAPELMCAVLQERDGAVAAANAQPHVLERLLKGIKVVATGPGLGTEGEASEFARALVAHCTLPMVVDADALNAFEGKTDLLRQAAEATDENGQRRVLVLTPHPGEMARLLGVTVKDVEADRVNLARSFATEHGVTLVLKGWRTLVAHPNGTIAVNTTGNPAMAKGGSGDILTGIVAAMLAQHGDNVAAAVEAAVFLHGLAGDFAALVQDEHTVLATDTVAHLADAFRARVVDADGLTWIAGTAGNGARTS